jgi:hypothetical protein
LRHGRQPPPREVAARSLLQAVLAESRNDVGAQVIGDSPIGDVQLVHGHIPSFESLRTKSGLRPG